MKLLHTADLHIGKIVNEVNLIEDQRYILKQIEDIAVKEEVTAIIVAGDVYDRPIPSAEAVNLLSEWLMSITCRGIKVIMISGNHDSPERLNFVSDLLKEQGLYISTRINLDRLGQALDVVRLIDGKEVVNVYLLPFIKPQIVKYHFPDKEINTFNDAVNEVCKVVEVDNGECNMLMTHQFVTGRVADDIEMPQISDSEVKISVGGAENVDVSCFDKFDYVALGHIHGGQKIGRDTVRYAGSPLKYSFSEVNHVKSVDIIEVSGKNSIVTKECRLMPVRDMRRLEGTLSELISEDYSGRGNIKDYICAVLTDEKDLMEPMVKLRGVYSNAMQIIINKEIVSERSLDFETAPMLNNKTTSELFEDFYTQVSGKELNEEQKAIIDNIVQKIGDEI